LKFSLKNIRRISNVQENFKFSLYFSGRISNSPYIFQGEFEVLLIFFRENLKFSLYFSGRISNSPYIFQGEFQILLIFFRENLKFSLYFSGRI
jgi:hypothetical protein